MNEFIKISPFEESTLMAVIESPAMEWIQQPYWGPGEWILPGHTPGVWSLLPWTGQVLIEPKLLRRSIQDDRRVGPITYLKELWRKLLASAIDSVQHTEPCLGNGVRLALPQTMRRGNRMAHEPQSGSENGGDDD